MRKRIGTLSVVATLASNLTVDRRRGSLQSCCDCPNGAPLGQSARDLLRARQATAPRDF